MRSRPKILHLMVLVALVAGISSLAIQLVAWFRGDGERRGGAPISSPDPFGKESDGPLVPPPGWKPFPAGDDEESWREFYREQERVIREQRRRRAELERRRKG